MYKIKIFTEGMEATGVWVGMGVPSPEGITPSLYRFVSLEKQAHPFDTLDIALEVLKSYSRTKCGLMPTSRARIGGVLYDTNTGVTLDER